ncbi:hypothetical protein DSG34_03950 [Salmonella enterica subsp. diarizonae]|nr:hypothetical protein [Salmonella enterica subsp. diarizonae]
MLQMKFKPRFIEAFHSGQKITSLRMMKFKCRIYQTEDEQEPDYFHEDTLRYYTTLKNIDGIHLSVSAGTTIEYLSDLAGLLNRQPYKRGDEIELVTEAEGGEWVPFATAIVADVSVVKGDQIERIDAIHDGFNPDYNPLTELYAFMRDVYHTADPVKEMYWLYTFTNVQMLPQWGGEA